MFAKGDYIFYENTGVCRVEDIGVPENLPAAARGRQYYTLSLIHSAGTIYIPVDTSVYMRPILTREQAQALIEKMSIQAETDHIRDQRSLTEHYRASFQSHECEDLVQLIKTVYMKNKNRAETGAKPGKIDLQYRKRAEELLHGELAVALGIPTDQIPCYIEKEVRRQQLREETSAC